MQVTVKSTKVLKTGTGDYGDWKLVKVSTNSGDYTTFADGSEALSPGSVIDITDLNEDDKGRSFKKYTVVSEGDKTVATKSDEMSKDDWAEKDSIKSASIEQQTAVDKTAALVALKHDYPDDPLANAAYNWAMSKLGNWSSQGISERTESIISPSKEAIASKAQITEIFNIIVRESISQDLALATMIREYGVGSTKELNALQAEDFKQKLTKGLEPEDVPF